MKKRIGLGTWSWGNKFFWDYQISNDDDLRETYKEALKSINIYPTSLKKIKFFIFFFIPNILLKKLINY